MTFAGGPTYMPEYLKTALKEKMFQGISLLIKIFLILMWIPILNNSKKLSKELAKTLEIFCLFPMIGKFGSWEEVVICNLLVFHWTFWEIIHKQLQTIQQLGILANFLSTKQRDIVKQNPFPRLLLIKMDISI